MMKKLATPSRLPFSGKEVRDILVDEYKCHETSFKKGDHFKLRRINSKGEELSASILDKVRGDYATGTLRNALRDLQISDKHFMNRHVDKRSNKETPQFLNGEEKTEKMKMEDSKEKVNKNFEKYIELSTTENLDTMLNSLQDSFGCIYDNNGYFVKILSESGNETKFQPKNITFEVIEKALNDLGIDVDTFFRETFFSTKLKVATFSSPKNYKNTKHISNLIRAANIISYKLIKY